MRAPSVALLLVLASPRLGAETRPPMGGTLVLALPEEPLAAGTPHKATRWIDQVLARATGETLYRDGRPILAEGLPTFVTPLDAQVRLKTTLRNHEGQPIDAQAVVAAWARLGPLAAGAEPIVSLRADGPIMVVVKTSRPALPVEIVRALSLPQAAVPGAGPFILVQNSPREIRLEAFASHPAGRPFLDRVILRSFGSRSEAVRAFELGRAQVSLGGASSFGRPTPGAQTFETAPGIVVFLGFGGQVSVPLRQAIGLGIDREAVRRFAISGPAASWPAPPPAPDQARVAIRANAPSRPISLYYDRSRAQDADAAQKVQAQLAVVALTVRIEGLDAKTFEARWQTRAGMDLYLGQCAPPLPQTAIPWLKICGAEDLPLYKIGLRANVGGSTRGLRFDETSVLRFDDAFAWPTASALGTR